MAYNPRSKRRRPSVNREIFRPRSYQNPRKYYLKGVKTKNKHVESRTKGTMILRCGGRFYKVLKIRSRRGSNYSFECIDLDTKEKKNRHFGVSGLLEAADQAFKIMKSPKDKFFLDLDNNGKWKVVSYDQLKKL
jgi:hypothetical protein